MKSDREGFLYPIVDVTTCIDCGICEKVCPMINKRESYKIRSAYGVKNEDENVRIQSSSGGFFSLLADYILLNGGVVFGSKFDENWNVVLDWTESAEEISKYRGSKYVQSRTIGSYKATSKFLKAGRLVLYSGTPCQIAGLKNYLNKDYENLITLDFICHGVPSPGVWQKYLKEIKENAFSTSVVDNKNTILSQSLKTVPVITKINFREKERFGWEKYGFVVYALPAFKDKKNIVLLSDMHKNNPYMKGFLANINIRPSCSNCPAKSGKSQSDICMADFWGAKEVVKEFYQSNGVSLVFAHTDKGNKLINRLKGAKISVSTEDVYLTNISYFHNTNLHSKRDDFFTKWRVEPIVPLMNKLSKPSIKDKLIVDIRLILMKLGLNYKLNKLLKRIK